MVRLFSLYRVSWSGALNKQFGDNKVASRAESVCEWKRQPTLWTIGLVLAKLGGLMLLGLLFARYVERPMMRLLRALGLRSNIMLIVLGLVLLVAGLTAMLGVPVAIGGFFAGLLFSRDRHSVVIGNSFESLYHLFVPFFFVGVGFALDLWRLGSTLGPALLLLGAAVVGKGAGSFFPACTRMPLPSAGLLAVSLIPRSEITLVIMERGLDLGAVSPTLFTSMVLVVVATMVGVPMLLLLFLKRDAPGPTTAQSTS